MVSNDHINYGVVAWPGIACISSYSPQSMGRWWFTSFWRQCIPWMTSRWPGIISMDSLKVNHAWSTWLPSTIEQLPGWAREEQWILSTFSKAFDTAFHSILIGKLGKCGLDEWVMRSMGWEQAEQQIPVSHNQLLVGQLQGELPVMGEISWWSRGRTPVPEHWEKPQVRNWP